MLITRDKCPTCLSSDFISIKQISYSDVQLLKYIESNYDAKHLKSLYDLATENFVICKCNNCSLIFQKNIPSDKLLAEIYGKWIVTKESLKRALTIHKSIFDSEASFVRSMFTSPTKKVKVLDFGSGWCKFLSSAKDLGFDCYALEYEQTRIDYAMSQGINVIGSDELKEDRFDYIHTEQVFEHLTNPSDDLEKLVKSLKVNGIIKIGVPAGLNILKAIDKMDYSAKKNSKFSLNPIFPLEHINCFTNESLIHFTSRFNLNKVYIPFVKGFRLRFSSPYNPQSFFKGLLFYPYYNFLKRTTSIYFRKYS